MASETDSCRVRLARYCVGIGLDVGFGGTPIVPTAICIDRDETDYRRHKHDHPTPTHIAGDAARLHWFRDGVLDYVYSSHCLEDFEDTTAVLSEWLRVIRHGGHLVLFLPDEHAYRKITSDRRNLAHKHDNFSLDYVKGCLRSIGYKDADFVHSLFPVPNNAYSFDLVVSKP